MFIELQTKSKSSYKEERMFIVTAAQVQTTAWAYEQDPLILRSAIEFKCGRNARGGGG
jgi:hypothetical protein